MLAGVGGVDACLFVVAATEGWKPQSEEHLRILELLGVRHGVVALTKADLVDDEWAEIAALDVADRVAGTFLEGAPVVPVAAPTGHGLDALRAALDELVATTPAAADRGRPRLWIDRVFAAKGSGTVVTGTLTGGSLAHDDAVLIEPGSHGRACAVDPVARRDARRDRRRATGSRSTSVVSATTSCAAATPWSRPVDGAPPIASTHRSTCWRRSTTRCRAGGAYLAYIGSRELPVTVRVLGVEALAPGASGAVRLFLPRRSPAAPRRPVRAA